MVAFAEQDYRSWSAACDRITPPRMLSWEAAFAGVYGRRAPRLSFEQKKLALNLIHELHESGASRRMIRRELIRRFRQLRDAAFAGEESELCEYGISPMLIIGLISLAANLIRLYLEWRRTRELTGWTSPNNMIG